MPTSSAFPTATLEPCRTNVEQLSRSAGPTVDIAPSGVVERRMMSWRGMAAETIDVAARDRIEFKFCAPVHLLAVYEQGTRLDGETFIEGLPRSTRRDVTRKLTFVPAGREYREWYQARTRTRLMYVYFDSAELRSDAAPDTASSSLSARLLFDEPTLWSTALKLKSLLESQELVNRLYLEALGAVLAHELLRLNAAAQLPGTPARGGLAGWQQRAVTAYIEKHLAEHIPLDTLARLTGLSRYYFCRVQAVVRRAAASLPQQPTHRAGQGPAGKPRVLGHRHRIPDRLQRHQLLQRSVPQGDRVHAKPLSPQRRVTVERQPAGASEVA